jgi:hypothetical protein
MNANEREFFRKFFAKEGGKAVPESDSMTSEQFFLPCKHSRLLVSISG